MYFVQWKWKDLVSQLVVFPIHCSPLLIDLNKYLFTSFLPSVAARKEVTIPMKPELEIVLGEKRWINTVVAKDIKVGEDFDLFCNVTMDVGHVAQINWLKNVRRSNHPQK